MSKEIEAALLGELLISERDRAKFFSHNIIINLNSSSCEIFKDTQNRQIFKAIQKLHENCHIINSKTVANESKTSISMIEEYAANATYGAALTYLSVLVEAYKKTKINSIHVEAHNLPAGLQLKYIEEKIAKLDIATANIAPETFEDKAYNWVMMAATGESRRLIAPLKIDKCQRLNYAMFSNRGLFSGMYAVEAERGSCKTSFAINIMIAVALHFRAAKEEKSKILFYSLDDNFSDYMEKFLALTMGIRRDIYRRKLKTEEIQNVSNAVFEKMAGLGIEVIEQKDLTKNASGAMEYSLIEKDVERRRQRGEKIEMVVIDYLQKLTMGDSGRGRSEAYEYQHIINSMKNKIQQVNDCALIILSQRTQLDDNVSEKHRNKINKSSQSRGRGYRGLPDAVDVSVALINRNSMDVSLNNQNDEVHYIDLYISKNKIVSAGLGYVPLMFYRYYCKFEEIEVMKNV